MYSIFHPHLIHRILVFLAFFSFFLLPPGFSKSGRLEQGQVQLVGPRAGIGTLLKTKNANKDVSGAIHSAFGWQMEVPYKSGDFTGYGEAGFMLLAVERGIFYPTTWGFFGFSYKNFGIGFGPVANRQGIGIGIAPYFQYLTPSLRIPITLHTEIVDYTYRMQIMIGFSIR